MRKKGIFLLSALGAVSLLCGFDSAETAESILEKASENSASSTVMSSNFTLNCDIDINIGDGETTTAIAVLADADFDIQTISDPFSASVEGNVNLSTFGIGEEIIVKTYVISSDESVVTYAYTEDSASDEEGEGTWTYSLVSADEYDLQTLLDLSSSLDYSQMEKLGLTWELADEAADYDGSECYLLTAVIDSSNLRTVIDKTEELVGTEFSDEMGLDEETVSMIEEMLDGLKINIEYYINTADCLPAAVRIDLNDTDLTTLNSYVTTLVAGYFDSGDADTTTTVEVALNDLSMEYTFTDENVEAITVPEEALEAVASGEAESLEDLADELTGAEG
ncbi:MAG: hypothetical protein LUG56_08500 [Lachnospiraceae bacterium]|nr:hypothetical protein [Lachnospiraceae bacterium]MCD7842490.1 hypothetical protein [Lachnospiraceae bacterium]